MTAALAKFDAPVDDGVCSALDAAGFVCVWDIHPPQPCSHWTGTTVDHIFLAPSAGRIISDTCDGSNSAATTSASGSNAPSALRLENAYIVPSVLSDHFPVVANFIVE